MNLIKYSVIVPAHNEQDNLEELYTKTAAVMGEMVNKETAGDGENHYARAGDWEIIFIDDGSSDSTYQKMKKIADQEQRVKIIKFRRNFGQTAAWSAGFDHASGEFIIVLDADLQNDPEDIPVMMNHLLNCDLDVVSGWRRHRQDNGGMVILSKIGNFVHRWMTGEKIHDHGCSLKVYRREALQDLELYGEMHRYITALLSWKGFRVGEVEVRHYPRRSGRTNYSIKKKLKGFLDLIVVKFWVQYAARPMHFFGAIGIGFILVGLILGGSILGIWLMRITGFANSSLPLLAVLLVLLGFQFLLTGVLADVVAKTYYAQKKAYSIKSTHGLTGGAKNIQAASNRVR